MPWRRLPGALWPWVRARLTEVGLGALVEGQQATDHHLRGLMKACLGMLGTARPEDLSRAMRDHLPPLGVTACTMTTLLPDRQGTYQLEVVARLSRELGQGKKLRLPVESLGIDASLEHRAAVVLMPLDFNGSAVGLVGFDWGARNPVHYEHLREVFSLAGHALGGCMQTPSLLRASNDEPLPENETSDSVA